MAALVAAVRPVALTVAVLFTGLQVLAVTVAVIVIEAPAARLVMLHEVPEQVTPALDEARARVPPLGVSLTVTLVAVVLPVFLTRIV